MVSSSDFTQTCNANLTDDTICTPSICCLEQGQLRYLPTLPGNILFAILFAIMIIPHLIFGLQRRTWSFSSWMSLGLVGEVVGYIGRIMLHNDIFSFDAFLTYLIPLTIAPAFITACIYLCLARLIHVLDPELRYTRLKPMTYTKIFVTFDVISLVLQGAGGGVAATADNDQETGDMGVDIMIAGLAFQVVSLLIFSALCGDFAWRVYKGAVRSNFSTATDADTAYQSGFLAKQPGGMQRSDEIGGVAAVDYAAIRGSKMFKGFVGALVTAVILIIIRSAYRLAELQEGFDSALANNEVLFMILDGLMIIFACVGLTVFHPGLALRGLWSMKGFKGRRAGAAKTIMMSNTEPSQ